MTTLTRESLLDKAQMESKVVDVPTFGEVLIRPVGEVRRSKRMSDLFDANGELIKENQYYQRLHRIIDQVCNPDGSPMFTDADIEGVLAELPSVRLDYLSAAIVAFNAQVDEPAAKKNTESNESNAT